MVSRSSVSFKLSDSTATSALGSNGVPRGFRLLDVNDLSVEQSFEMTQTKLKTRGYEIGVNGISLRPLSDAPAVEVIAGDLSYDMFVPFGRGLGKGASGHVIKAFKTDTWEILALKSIGVLVQSQRHQMIKELDTYISCANCPYIVDFHGAFYQQGITMLVLEYMNRGSLQHVIDTFGPMSEPILQRIAKQIVLGLAHVHARRQIHRDIKPANILLNSSGMAKVADFGIAKELDEMMNAKTFVGTQIYMSPERIQTESYGCSADIWSFGLSLMTCALGRFPYAGTEKGFIHVFQSITHDKPPVLPKSRYSVGMRSFISKCLVKDPEERWSAENLLYHPWLADVDIESDCRWPWENDGASADDLDDLRSAATILRDRGQTVPVPSANLNRLAASLNVSVDVARCNLEAFLSTKSPSN